jgi:L-aminopeptidase/D-esterase-like protein
MKHLKIGHYTQAEQGTGLSVFLFDQPVCGAYTLCGSAPAAHELTVLDLDAMVSGVNGLLLAGGSAFGLSAVDGVLRWLKERNRGFATSHGVVPIVPAVALYDLAFNESVAPMAEHAYQACQQATENNVLQGRIGAGTGATVGKFVANTRRMSGGLGRAELRLANGVTVLAYAAVNSVGDVTDASGNIIAGACLPNGDFANCTQMLLSGCDDALQANTNTTLVAVFTNANFSKVELKRISKMALAGMPRAISPVFTQYDGDIVFCFSVGAATASEKIVGAMAAEAVRQAIVNAVQDSKIL